MFMKKFMESLSAVLTKKHFLGTAFCLGIIIIVHCIVTDVFLQRSNKNALSRPNTSSVFQHDIFARACYKYENLTAFNTCCRMHNYASNSSDFTRCVDGNAGQKNRPETPLSKMWNRTEGQHWVLIGDSHIRCIFNVLVNYFSKHQLLHKFTHSNDVWEEFHIMRTALHASTFHEDLEMVHKEYPVNLTFHWDPRLTRLTELLDKWETSELPSPTYILTGSALHWMAFNRKILREKGPEASAAIYQDHLTKILPQLSQLAETLPVIFKLLDHLQIKQQRSVHSRENIDRYNNIAAATLKDAGVVLWDSAQPLSDMYNKVCDVKNLNTEESRTWYCKDKRHIGYIMIRQYANMFLNHVCNHVVASADDNVNLC